MNMKTFKVDKTNWNNIVKSNESSTIYNYYDWGEIHEDLYGQNFICIKEGSTIFPLNLVKSYIFGNRLISMPFADYGGPIFQNYKEEDMIKVVSRVKNIGDQFDVDFIEIRSPIEVSIPLFEKQGFIKRFDYVTFIINLEKSEEELWNDIDTERRTAIRKAEEKELRFLESNSKDSLKDFYSLYLERMKGIGSPPQPFRYFERLWNIFYPDNIKLSFVETQKGVKIAAALFFIYNTVIHYTYGSSSIKYWDLRPNDFLFWNVIKRGSKEKYKTLDLGRTRHGSGVYLFKKKWGGKKVKMPYLYYFRKKELKERQEIKYDRFSALWSKYMPFFLTKRIGPWLIKQIG